MYYMYQAFLTEGLTISDWWVSVNFASSSEEVSTSLSITTFNPRVKREAIRENFVPSGIGAGFLLTIPRARRFMP
jgi:hypothetical protein